MSAFVVTKETIDTIVTIWIALEIERTGEPFETMHAIGTEIGGMLWRENHRSVNARYNERSRCKPYAFAPVALPRDLAAAFPRALGAVACLMYQSCKHKAWTRSRAYTLLAPLRRALESRVDQVRNPHGSGMIAKRAGWEVTHRDELTWALVSEGGYWNVVNPTAEAA